MIVATEFAGDANEILKEVQHCGYGDIVGYLRVCGSSVLTEGMCVGQLLYHTQREPTLSGGSLVLCRN